MDIVTQISAADFQAIYQNSQQLQRQTGVETFSKIVNGEPVTVASDIANFKVSDKEKAAKEFEVMVLSQFIGEWLKRSPRAQVIMNRVAGAVFVALALRLASAER